MNAAARRPVIVLAKSRLTCGTSLTTPLHQSRLLSYTPTHPTAGTHRTGNASTRRFFDKAPYVQTEWRPRQISEEQKTPDAASSADSGAGGAAADPRRRGPFGQGNSRRGRRWQPLAERRLKRITVHAGSKCTMLQVAPRSKPACVIQRRPASGQAFGPQSTTRLYITRFSHGYGESSTWRP